MTDICPCTWEVTVFRTWGTSSNSCHGTKQKYNFTTQFLPCESHLQLFPTGYSEACFVAKELRGHKEMARQWCSSRLAWIKKEDPEHLWYMTWNIGSLTFKNLKYVEIYFKETGKDRWGKKHLTGRWWKGKQEEMTGYSISVEHKSYHPRQAGCHQSSALDNMVTPSSCWFSASNMEGDARIAASYHWSWYWQMVRAAGLRKYLTTNYQTSSIKKNIVQNTIFNEKYYRMVLFKIITKWVSRQTLNVTSVIFIEISI